MKTIKKRLLSLLLCVALLLAWVPIATQAAPAADTRVADPSTMDSWKDQFLNTGSTENAGAVWTDKSVFTDASAFPGITQQEPESFLVALSALGSNMTVTGASNVPTDTVMILDLSSSMYNGYSRDPSTVKTMLAAVNQSIDRLQKMNRNNRVGVVVYYGGPDRNQSNKNNSMVLLPLDRYSGSTTFLKANVTSNRLISVAVNSGLKNSAGKTVPQTTRTVTDVAGTYAQLGILDAMDQLLAADTVVPASADYQPGAERLPVFIFMSDGEPTAATHQFTQKVDAGMGNNTISIRNPDETDFVTQLTAAYAKTKVDDHYQNTTPLFYSLSLGTSVSLAVMDPANYTTAKMDGYWNDLLDDGKAAISVMNSPNGWGAPTVEKTYTVSRATVSGKDFPADKAVRDYTDQHFTASTASQLTDAFTNIVNQISIVSKYNPTLTEGDEQLSGYVSFVDKIGQYMNVTDIKGIIIDGTLYSGGELSKNFVTGGGNLGTYDAPTALGDEMVWAVQARLGIDSADTARTLIGLAYEYGQLRYNGPEDYSNYIGWYANAAGNYLGFWHDQMDTLPEATGNIATDPAYIVKSYGYLGAVDEAQGVRASDLMYATVQVRRHIQTGEESVIFAVPAALIPLITYNVALDINGNVTGMKITGADNPIRLVYEVALEEGLDEYTLTERVSPQYLAANTDQTGAVSFYSNQFEADLTVGYGKVNTYSYFNPSRENGRYYYLEDTPVYTDQNGTRYTGDVQPTGTLYRAYTVYTASEALIHYRRLSDAALATAKRNTDGSWYIPAGNVHVNLEGYTVTKTDNSTDTMPDAYIPFVDAHNHSVGDLGYNFIIGATLGNNGRLKLMPATGIKLTKTLAEGVAPTDDSFTFTIAGNVADGTVPARLVTGEESIDTTVTFADGEATVSLKAGQSLYIAGLTPGTYTVTEAATLTYLPEAESATVTVTDGMLTPVTFVNGLRGTGDLTISKKVIHSLGSDYLIPNRHFTVEVTLTGLGSENATFEAVHTAGHATSVTTDANGRFTVELAHDEQIQIFGLPAGITATVREVTPGAGFTPAYWERGVEGDGVVTITKGETVSVSVANTYTPEKTTGVKVKLQGTKHLNTDGTDWNGAEFTFHLQKFTDSGWQTIATTTANEAKPVFHFNDAMSAEEFTAPGTYTYQVLEQHGGETIDGVTYDATLHTFGILVTDQDMDGKLEIGKVISFHADKEFIPDEDGWTIDISFTNTYEAEDCTVVLDVQKALRNPSGSPLVSLAGYRFGLFRGDTLFATSEMTDAAGEARMVLRFTLADEGIHTFTLKELVPNTPIPGMTYDPKVYTVTITVTDNGDGTTSGAITAIDAVADYETPVFTNTYEPTTAQLPIDFVSKHLTGRELVAGEFTFAITGDGTLLTGTNDAQGRVSFNAPLTFDKVGIYRYEIRETGSDGNGVTLDKAVYNLIVTVTDEAGILTATHQIMNLAENTVVFENDYIPTHVTATIEGNKTLTGRMLVNEEFTFLLTDENGVELERVRNFANGTFTFRPITYTQPGIYRYQVSELAQSAASFGITYDERVYDVTVTVTDNQTGALVAQVAVDGETIQFENIYTAEPTSARIPGEKQLSGKLLTGGDFRFMLYASNARWEMGEKLETVSNGEDGTFVFSEITYETPGTRYYLVKEEHGGAIIDGVYYDPTVYHVEIAVVDNLRGQLVSHIRIFDEFDLEQEGVIFRNRYAVTGKTQVVLNGTKTLEGKDLCDGEFIFALYETNELYEIGDTPLTITTNENGRFSFTLDYTGQQTGSTFYYLVKEVAGDAPGVTYDDTLYHIQVAVVDDGKGGVQAVVTTDGVDDTLSFVNTYKPVDPPPETGDYSMVAWLAMLLVSCGGVVTLLSLRKKETF